MPKGGAKMLRILIVEDKAIFREELKKWLYGHFPSMVIEEAGDGDEALQKVYGNPPHLIFMDIRLPGVNGLQLTRKIKMDFPDIHIAILTDYDFPEYRQAALQFGADSFFVKNSFNCDEVEALVGSISPGPLAA
jgi:DNA-binding NarL/FixJ family response regulator